MGYILFSSENKLSITAYPNWDGIIEYSYDNQHWREWNGEKIINNVIYMRGINNTEITTTISPTLISFGANWELKGENIKCQGNIENLLDYKSVINNVHPKMNDYCFCHMFSQCRALIEAPQMLSVTLSRNCYQNMFFNCQGLTNSSLFPTFTIAKEAIMNQQMFKCCSIQKINIILFSLFC